MRNLGWGTKLTALFTLILGVSLLFQLFYVVPMIRNREVELTKAHQEEVARSIARELDIDLLRVKNRLTRMAERAEFRYMDVADQKRTMVQHVEISYLLSSLFVMDAGGWFVSGTVDDLSAYRSKSYADALYFTVPFAQGQVYFAPPRFYAQTGLVGTSVSVPIESDAGERVGVLMGGMRLNETIENVTNYPLDEGMIAYVVDREGTVVAHSGMDLFALEEGPLSLNRSDDLLVQYIVAGEQGRSQEHDHEGTPYSGCYAILESNGWGVVVETPMDTILAESSELARQLLLVNVALFGLALAVSLVFVRQITAGQRRAEEALQRRNLELAALNAVAQALSGSLELRDLLDEAHSRVLHAMGFAGGLVCLADEGTGELALRSCVGFPLPLVKHLEAHGLSGTLCSFVYREGKVLGLEDLHVGAPVDVRGLLEVGLQSYVGVPIVHKDRVLGTFCLVDTAPHPISEADCALLTAIGQQIGVVVENTRLYEETRARVHQMELLLSASEAAASTLDSAEVLRHVARAVARTTGADMVGAYLLDEGGTALRPVAGYHVPPERLTAYLQFQIPLKGHSFVEEAWQNKQAVFTSEAGNDPRLDAQTRQLFQATSVLLIPMIVQGEIIGALLAVWWEEAHRFTEEELRLGEGIVRQAAVAIQNAGLFEETRRRAGQLEALSEIGRAIGSTLDLDAVLRLILEQLEWVAPYDTVSLWLREGEVMRIRAAMGFDDPEVVVGLAVPIQEDRLFQELVHTCQPLIIADVQQDERFHGFAGMEWVRSWLGVPLLSKGEVVGLLTIDKGESGSYTAETADLAFAFGQQAAVAIENARLYEAARLRERQARALYEAGQLAARLEGGLEVGLQTFFERLTGVGDFDRWWVPLLDEDGLTMQGLAGRWEDVPDEQMKRRVVLAEEPRNPVVIAIQNRETVMINDPEHDERLGDLPENFHRTAGKYVTVPMVSISGERVIGALSLGRPISGRDVSADDVDLAHMLAGQVVLVIENARLFTETRRRVRELRLLHDVGLAAASGVRLEETLQAAAVALAAELQGNNVALLLLDSESGALRMEASVGYSPDVVKDLRIRLGEGITGWVAQHGEPALVPDVRLDPRYIEVASDIRSELCIPLVAGSRVIGVLNVESPQVNAFTEDDQRLLSTLASNLTVLIERARLFEEVEAARNESQQRAEALEEANVRLRELDRLKSEFLANMSHELRTPLNSVIGFSEVLIDGLVGEVSSEQKECLGNIRSSGKDLLALINDILDLSKIEAGRVELKMVPFDVAGLLAEVQVTIRPLIEQKSQVLKVEQADGLPHLTADRFRVKQVLLNLLSNAHKFTLVEGHIGLCCRLVDQATMLFSVTDTGIGIKPEDQRIIFEEFRQVDGSASREVTGTGLGLAISKHLVEMHEGRIWVESEYGHGATFSLLLPLAGPPAAGPGVAGEREIT